MENLSNLNNFELIGGEYTESSYFDELICENDGSFSRTNDYMVFNSNNLEVVVTYDISVYGKIETAMGDNWTPSHTDVTIIDKDIELKEVIVNEYPYDIDEIPKDLLNRLIKEINKNL